MALCNQVVFALINFGLHWLCAMLDSWNYNLVWYMLLRSVRLVIAVHIAMGFN